MFEGLSRKEFNGFIDSVGEDKFLDLIDKIQIKKYLLEYLRWKGCKYEFST